jgi:hypothetical protein
MPAEKYTWRPAEGVRSEGRSTPRWFGQQTTFRGAFILIAGHTGERIAYARMNGIVPPWSEEQQQQQQKPAAKP